jgi:hypothetical protein
VGSVVVAVDVGADRGAGLVDRLELLAPDAALLELGEPGLDEGLALGVAVAAAPVGDPSSPRRERNARLVNAEPLSVPSVSLPGAIPRSAAAASITAIASWARQRTSSAQPVLTHQPLRALPVDSAAELAAGQGGDHPGPVRRVRARDRQHYLVDRGQPASLTGRWALRAPVDRLAADLRNAGDDGRGAALRDQFAGPGDAHPHSQPLFERRGVVKAGG